MVNENFLGKVVKDKVTGFKGVVTAQTSYLYGCDRVAVQSRKPKTKDERECIWFDVLQLDIIDDISSELGTQSNTATIKTGGPRMDAPTR